MGRGFVVIVQCGPELQIRNRYIPSHCMSVSLQEHLSEPQKNPPAKFWLLFYIFVNGICLSLRLKTQGISEKKKQTRFKILTNSNVV